MGKSRYSELLTHYPAPILAIILVIVISCTILNVFVGKPPDFSDPLQGFVPRYTKIHSSHSAWNNLLESTAIGSEPSRPLTIYPRDEQTTASYHAKRGHTTATTTTNANNVQHEATTSPAIHYKEQATPSLRSNSASPHLLYRRDSSEANLSASFRTSTVDDQFDRFNRSLSPIESFFCDSRPRQGYSQLIFSVDTPLSELDMNTFDQLCQLQTLTESSPHYRPICEYGCLCRTFSLVNYIAYLSGKKSCYNVNNNDLDKVLGRLNDCRRFYDVISIDCWFEFGNFDSQLCNVSETCKDETLFQIYHYVVSKDQLLTTTFVHMAQGKSSHSFYLDLYGIIKNNKQESVRLVALNMGLKGYVFEKSLLSDSWWIGLALFIVILIIWLYTESIFITSMVFVSMLFTIILSFTLYQFIFRIEYFPFLNLLAAVVVVGIGADDLFIYWKTWTAIKLGRNASILERIVSHAFKHASAAMFVTSASTATAFYASTYTDLVSIRCFCIYAGTCVLVHYLIVITWLPACVVLYEKYALSICHTYSKENKVFKCLNRLHTHSTKLARVIHDRQSKLSTLSYIWLPLFFVVATGAALALFVWPKFSAPSSHMLQMLTTNHPFEVYDRDVKNHFEFTSNQDYLPITFIFGVDPTFNGEYFKLTSSGSLVFKPLPDLSLPETQLWFSTFCFELRQQYFYDDSSAQPNGCFIEELRSWMRFRSCSDDPVCCRNLSFPYNQSVFSECLGRWSTEAQIYKLYTVDPGVRYRNRLPSAIIISFWSNVRFDYNFNAMQEFYNNVSNFVADRVSSCPGTQSNDFLPFYTTAGGWLFYDVQLTLLNSLPISLLVILTASSGIIFCTTLNVLLTISALISISCSILTTLGILALMRWELNVLESVIVSLAVGLSMDFPLHVAVAYRIASSTRDRKSRVIVSLRHVGGSLSAAMATTLVAGLCMLPAEVLAYTKLGTFLAIVAVSSWFYATLFMPSLLIHIGPIGSFLQLDLHRCFKRKRNQTGKYFDKTVYSDEMSSDAAQPLPTTSSHTTLQLEPVIEESAEDLELSELEGTITSSTSLLPASNSQPVHCSESFKRLSPIIELCDSTTSIDSLTQT